MAGWVGMGAKRQRASIPKLCECLMTGRLKWMFSDGLTVMNRLFGGDMCNPINTLKRADSPPYRSAFYCLPCGVIGCLRAPLAALGPVLGFIRNEPGVSGSFMGIAAFLPLPAFSLCSPLTASWRLVSALKTR